MCSSVRTDSRGPCACCSSDRDVGRSPWTAADALVGRRKRDEQRRAIIQLDTFLEKANHESIREVLFLNTFRSCDVRPGPATRARKASGFRPGLRHDVRRSGLEDACYRCALLGSADDAESADSHRWQRDYAAGAVE